MKQCDFFFLFCEQELTVGSLGQVMLDTVGPELQVVNKNETPISLEENGTVVLTPHQGQEASSSLLPINFSGLAKVNTCSCCFFSLSDLLSYAVFTSMRSAATASRSFSV